MNLSLQEKILPRIQQSLDWCQPKVEKAWAYCQPRLEKFLAWAQPRTQKIYKRCLPYVLKSWAWCQPRLQKLQAWARPYLQKLYLWWQPRQEKIRVWTAPYTAKLQTRWNGLAAREKSIVKAGSIVTGILLAYALIWLPLDSHLDDLRVKIQHQRKTAAWMQAADAQIRILDNRDLGNSNRNLVQRLNVVQEKLRQSPLNQALTQLAQSNDNEIHCVFDHVEFDSLMQWLIPFTQQQNLTVTQATVKKLNNLGLVQADFTFRVG